MNRNPYHLFLNPRSPFARRIRLALRRQGMEVKESIVDAFQNPADLNAANPLGLLPTLITPEGHTVSDSSHILEYLEDQTGAIWPGDLDQRLAIRQTSVLAAGLMQSSVLYFQENKMHDVPSEYWLKEHLNVLEATLAFLSSAPKENFLLGTELTQAGWDLAVALEYMGLRIPEVNWAKYPLMNELLEVARKDSYFVETTPKI